jgi:hypothetical protein
MTKNPLSKRATRTERTIGQTTHARNASAVRTIAAVACMGAALISTDVRADQYVTLNELIGMSCTGGPPFVGGVTIQFDKDGILYNVVSRPQARGVARDSYRGMLTYMSPDGATFSFEKLSGNTLTGYGLNGVSATWDCQRQTTLRAGQ